MAETAVLNQGATPAAATAPATIQTPAVTPAPVQPAATPPAATEAPATRSDDAGTAAAPANPPTVEYGGRQIDRNDAKMLSVLLTQQGKEVPAEVKQLMDAPAPKATDGEPGEEPRGQVTPSPRDGQTPAQPPKAKAASQAATADPEKLSQARQALKRWQWPDELIATLPQEEVLRRGEEAAKSQAQVATAFNERTALKTQLESLLSEMNITPAAKETPAAPAKKTQTPPQPKQQQQQQQPADKDPILAILDPLKDDDLLKDVYTPLTQIVGLMKQESAAKVAAAEAKALELERQSDELALELARRDLSKEVPQLKDANSYARVKNRVFSLANLPGYHDADGNPLTERLMRDAVRLELGEQIKTTQQAQLTASYQRQTQGQPEDLGDRTELPTAAMTNDQKATFAYELLGKGKTPEQVREILRRIPGA